MHDLINLLTLLASLAICGRLLTYRRKPGTTYRFGVSWCAWVLIVCTGGTALQILVAGSSMRCSPWTMGVLGVLAVMAWRAQGNVARILQVD